MFPGPDGFQGSKGCKGAKGVQGYPGGQVNDYVFCIAQVMHVQSFPDDLFISLKVILWNGLFFMSIHSVAFCL